MCSKPQSFIKESSEWLSYSAIIIHSSHILMTTIIVSEQDSYELAWLCSVLSNSSKSMFYSEVWTGCKRNKDIKVLTQRCVLRHHWWNKQFYFFFREIDIILLWVRSIVCLKRYFLPNIPVWCLKKWVQLWFTSAQYSIQRVQNIGICHFLWPEIHLMKIVIVWTLIYMGVNVNPVILRIHFLDCLIS